MRFNRYKKWIYFLYFIKTSNWSILVRDLTFVKRKFNVGWIKICFDMINSSLSLGNSFHEYLYYGFIEKTQEERNAYATMSFMYEFQKKNNPRNKRNILKDKRKFYNKFDKMLGRDWLDISLSSDEDVRTFISDKNKIVLKKSSSGGGKAVEIISISKQNTNAILGIIKEKKYDIIEEFVQQHQALQCLSPNSLNTVRLITHFTKDHDTNIIGASLRMGIEKQTDNLSSGGIACSIDVNTGIISNNGVSFDIRQPQKQNHPISKVQLVGFKIPFWDDVLEMCIYAAKQCPENRSIGWDVAITESGPILIEGNHDWGARVWQMPKNIGLKHLIYEYK